MIKLFIALLLISSSSFAIEKNKNPITLNQTLSSLFDVYAKQKSKEIEGDVMKDIDQLASLKLNEKTDLKLIKNVIRTLIKLDETDPSRTAVMVLGPSYGQNTKLYKKAFSEFCGLG